MEAKPAKGQGANPDGDKTHMGVHKMSPIRKSDQSRLDSFDKRNLFYPQNLLDYLF
jgi:hypothetical protein